MKKHYPTFTAALLKLGDTRDEIARKLGISRRTLFYYLDGTMLPKMEKISQYPELIEALVVDSRALQDSPDIVQFPA